MLRFSSLFRQFIFLIKVPATVADVEKSFTLPDFPRLFVLGEILTATALFASYYNFNLVYQEEASSTLEFVQRCVVGINPPTGTKTATTKVGGKKSGKASEKRNNTVNPHVCTLLRKLMDFEWLHM
ncbi:hypothetical protein QQF64_035578 [Cirrhinus molitorella]|uniref:Uncharacterized protein n=1 Tax=Cirrhinus molitorella TaxID=172907 RepID=A0ABR3NG62_9TELE